MYSHSRSSTAWRSAGSSRKTRNQRSAVSLRCARIGLGLGHPAAELLAARVGGRPRPAAARALRDDLDHPLGLQLGQLGIDLAVARVPRVAERAVEALRQLVAGRRLEREQAEDGVSQGHGASVMQRLDMSFSTCIISTYERRRRVVPLPPPLAARRRHVRPAAGDARPVDRRHRAADDRRVARRLLAVRLGRHRLPRDRHRLAADLRAAVGPPRAPRAAADRHRAVPRRLGAWRRPRRTWSS